MAEDPNVHADLTPGVSLELVADPRRRNILAIVQAQDPPLSIKDIGEELVDDQADVAGESRGLLRHLALLHHRDLPKLSEMGVLTYDPDRRRVTEIEIPGDPRWSEIAGRPPAE